MTALRTLLLWGVLTGLTTGCEDETPVLTGIPQTPLLQKAAEGDNAQTASPKEKQRYAKSPAVYVDVRYLGGKPYPQVRELLSEQLGRLHATEPSPKRAGDTVRYERGEIRVINNTIAMIKVALPKPLRRTEALELLGFPPYVGGYTIFHREYRLHHEWGFRRIRLKREDRRSERVIEVEAWRWLPGERELGR